MKVNIKINKTTKNQTRKYTTKATTKATKILISPTTDPYINKAIEDFHFSEAKIDQGEQILYLWQNKPAVFIGRNQNPWKECFLSSMEEDDVSLVRRFTGGGAVYQDLGNINWSLFQNKKEVDVPRNLSLICSALAPLPALPTGRNDISVLNQKVSGSAFRYARENHLHHGTILFDVDLDRMQKYLHVNKEKLISKGVESVKARVVNIKSIDSSFSIDRIRNNIIDQFRSLHGNSVPVEEINLDKLNENIEFVQLLDQLKEWKWIYGETPNFEYSIEKRFEGWGVMDLYINSKDGKISEVKLYSDSLFPDLIDQIADQLTGVRYSRDDVWGAIISMARTLEVDNHPAVPFLFSYAQFLRDNL